ncbi:MAG: hypothetical protein ACT4PO_15740 [Actinomycetota bacterium]
MNGSRWERIAAGTGIVWVVLTAVGSIIQTNPPGVNDPVGKITSYYVVHRSGILLGEFLIGLGGLFFLWFLGSMWSHFRRAEGEPGRVSAVVFGAGVLTLAVFLVEGSMYTALAYRIAREGDPRIIRAVWDMASVAATFRGYTVAALFAAIAVVVLRTGALPRWIGGTAVVLGLLQIVRPLGVFANSGPFVLSGAFSGIGFALDGIWVLATSFLLVRAQP